MVEKKQQERAADRTRQHLLEVASDEIYREGFQGLRINSVLEKAGLTKGAIYHYFPSKQALGFAVVEEIIAARVKEVWIDTLEEEADIGVAIGKAFEKADAIKGVDVLKYGCPLNNLAQEMSPIDEGFRDRTRQVFHDWLNAVVASLERGKRDGRIRADVDSQAAATYILASIEGCIGLAKNEGDPGLVTQCAGQLDSYLGTLRQD